MLMYSYVWRISPSIHFTVDITEAPPGSKKKKWTGSDLTYKQMREHQCSARKLENLPSWGTPSMLSNFLVTQLNILFFDCCKVPDELKVNQISKTWETFLVTGGIISAAKLWALEMLKVQTERQVKLLS